ncbi:2-aminomuconic semialdehyde dehydrogenase-like [Liolophura sinensis]|uniref:2-aminomuconic semialdehyde dehydrogenase-like n=1 Tax=Liolophura sinensis TaxID=3198878 RepID=UPI0031597E5A
MFETLSYLSMTEVVVENFIGGEFVKCDRLLDSFDPSTGEVWAKIPDSGSGEVDDAIRAAKDAFPGWSGTPLKQRSAIMMKVADILESKLDEFAELESRDQGKPVWLARAVDIPRAILNMRFFATSMLHELNSSSILEPVGALNYTMRYPVGVAGLITPWNLPLYLLTFKVAPAIAAGNTVVVKPSEMTSVSAWALCKVFKDAGVPSGVVNIVFGRGQSAGEALVKHPDVPLISFTGGTVTAEKLRLAAAPFCKKMSLELGGKNAAVIFKDADLDQCIPTTIKSSFINQGEVCLCTSRIFVQQEIYKTFVEKFVTAARAIKVGDPRKAESWMGALISKDHLAKVKGYVEVARAEGATILCGDGVEELELEERNRHGYFMRPTVITDVKDDSRLMKEEIFGPVTCIVPFQTEEEVIRRANDVKYGLCATVWTKDSRCLHHVSQKLQVGTVWANCWLVRDLNMPFGGTKSSGLGREGAKESLEFYTEVKTICLKL